MMEAAAMGTSIGKTSKKRPSSMAEAKEDDAAEHAMHRKYAAPYHPPFFEPHALSSSSSGVKTAGGNPVGE
jgi:hypothetical protein